MGTVVGTVTVLTVGVVKGDAVDSDAVVTVVTSGVLSVVCDSVVNVVGLTVLSVTRHKKPYVPEKSRNSANYFVKC